MYHATVPYASVVHVCRKQPCERSWTLREGGSVCNAWRKTRRGQRTERLLICLTASTSVYHSHVISNHQSCTSVRKIVSCAALPIASSHTSRRCALTQESPHSWEFWDRSNQFSSPAQSMCFTDGSCNWSQADLNRTTMSKTDLLLEDRFKDMVSINSCYVQITQLVNLPGSESPLAYKPYLVVQHITIRHFWDFRIWQGLAWCDRAFMDHWISRHFWYFSRTLCFEARLTGQGW